ncbi:BA14K family protein [Hoeflea sp. TYP-13]|uniref:BA14K family protein n=1 Tax=Hoeflea sp. TYP-13 TaxID=3230023 RepID=UPI0034C5D382
MGISVKAIAATLAVTVATITPLSQAYSHDRGHRHYHNNDWGGPKHHNRRHKRHRGPVIIDKNNNDDALLLGVLGLAAGALITGAILSGPANQPAYNPGPEPGYVPPARDYYPPAPQPTYAGGTMEPWTDEWYRYCSRRYRSFNPATGTFRGYDGYDHFCVAR